MADVRLTIRAYLYEVAAAHIRGVSVQDAPTIAALAEDVGVNANYLTQVLSGDRSLNLVLLWQLMEALRERGFAPTVEDAIYWSPLRSARSLPALDAWRPNPVAEAGEEEPRLHITLDAYLEQMAAVSHHLEEPLPVPRTRTLAEAAGVSTRSVQRLRADAITQVSRELLGGIVGHLHGMGINVRPAQLITEPVVLRRDQDETDWGVASL